MDKAEYREQDGCHNCQRVFIKDDYDESCSYYCTFDAPKRPMCGSVAMGESFGRSGKRPLGAPVALWDKRSNKWDSWYENREVEAWGKCPRWKAGKDA